MNWQPIRDIPNGPGKYLIRFKTVDGYFHDIIEFAHGSWFSVVNDRTNWSTFDGDEEWVAVID